MDENNTINESNSNTDINNISNQVYDVLDETLKENFTNTENIIINTENNIENIDIIDIIKSEEINDIFVDNLLEKYKLLEKEFAEKNNELYNTKIELNDYKKQLEKYKAELSEAQIIIDDSNKTIKYFQNELNNKKEEINELNDKLYNTNNKIEELTTKNEKLNSINKLDLLIKIKDNLKNKNIEIEENISNTVEYDEKITDNSSKIDLIKQRRRRANKF
jgi:predicted nuclease with TOPRIM domain